MSKRPVSDSTATVHSQLASESALNLPKKVKVDKLQLNFPADYNDHFETPTVAYRDLLPLLIELADILHKPSVDALTVYDPYFCRGTMKAELLSLGVSNVINNNRDFYRDIDKKNIPGTLHATA
jgi:hypothetical protein